MLWTIDAIKAAMPTVKVQVGKHIYTGYLASRNKHFPTVYYGPFSLTANAKWSWDAIQRSLNTNTPLLA